MVVVEENYYYISFSFHDQNNTKNLGFKYYSGSEYFLKFLVCWELLIVYNFEI